MKIGHVLAGMLVLGLVSATALRAEDAAGFFNGKDLSGFEGLEKHWSVKDGALVGSSQPEGIKFNTFLCSTKKYKDFELTCQVRILNSVGNSGIQVRSEVINKERFVVKGPQCDMGDVYWGSLYGEQFGGMMQAAPKEVVTKALKKGEFNDYSIRVEGKHVTIKLNGQTTVDADFPKLPDEGIIAFQLHQGPAMEVTFRNIKLKELKAK